MPSASILPSDKGANLYIDATVSKAHDVEGGCICKQDAENCTPGVIAAPSKPQEQNSYDTLHRQGVYMRRVASIELAS